MRLSGGILVLVSAVLAGLTVSSRLKIRVAFLSEILMLISRFSMEIEYVNLPLFEMLKKTAQSNCCKSLDFIYVCLDEWEKGEDFNVSWSRAIEKNSLPLKKEEKERLLSLGNILGTSDADGQRSMLALYKQYFSVYEQKAREECEKYAKMSVTVSVITGVGIFVMLL